MTRHFEQDLPEANEAMLAVLARYMPREEVEKFTGRPAAEVAGKIKQFSRELMNRFPVGSTVSIPEEAEPLTIHRYAPKGDYVDEDVHFTKPDGSHVQHSITALLNATLVTEGAVDSRPARWETLRKRVRKIVHEEIGKITRPIDFGGVEDRIVLDVTKKIARGKAFVRTDPPEITEDEIRVHVQNYLRKQYDI